MHFQDLITFDRIDRIGATLVLFNHVILQELKSKSKWNKKNTNKDG